MAAGKAQGKGGPSISSETLALPRLGVQASDVQKCKIIYMHVDLSQ